jgi:ankyrin repeat protein
LFLLLLFISVFDAGADLGIADTDGLTPLHAAAAAGHETVVGLLLGRGADAAAATPEGWTVLHAAASVGVEAILDTILAAVEAGAGAAAAAGSEGGAGEEDEDEEDGPKIEDVEENEAGGSGNGSGSSNNNHNPFDPVDGDGLTPFLVACSFGHLDCARRLLAVGADPTRKDSQGKSATDLADWHSGMDAEVAEVIRESQS